MRNDQRFIHIIDSPDDGDFLAERREGVSVEALLKLRPDALNVRTNFYTVVNQARLEETIKEIAKLVADAPHYPIIHFSCHARPEGITLTTLTAGRGITWAVLAQMFAPLAQATARKWTLCLSACHGIHGEQMQLGEVMDRAVGRDAGTFAFRPPDAAHMVFAPARRKP